MDFPAVERVLYDKNPLAEVVCQFRFPRLLALDEGIPAEFQRLIGSAYPFVETQEVAQLSFGIGVAPAAPITRTSYSFITEDRLYKVNLSSEAITMSTERYVSWGEFFPHIRQGLEALLNAYPVPMFTRVGLRYVDVISRRALGLADVRWSDLVRQSALGLLAEHEVPIDDVLELNAATALKLEPSGKVVVRTGFGTTEQTGDEQVFVVDADFFEEGSIKGLTDAVEICTRFNATAGRAFRWFLSPQLHAALGPRKPS